MILNRWDKKQGEEILHVGITNSNFILVFPGVRGNEYIEGCVGGVRASNQPA